jgi:hypothetical protein
MSDNPDLKGPYIVWEDYGTEGWKPTSYASAKEALTSPRYQSFILTKPCIFEVVEGEASK